MEEIKDFWSVPLPELFDKLKTSEDGLTDEEAITRLKAVDQIIEKKQWVSDITLFL